MICGLCAGGRHEECNGLCRASYAFCGCADRGHQHPALSARTETPSASLAHLRQSPNAIDHEDDGAANG